MVPHLTRCVLATAVLVGASQLRALDIQFTVDETNAPNAQALAGFEQAAQVWESLLSNNVNVYVKIGMSNFGAENSNIIGQAGSEFYTGTYTEIRNALIDNSTSAADIIALGQLPTGSTYTRLINYTADSPTPVSTPWLNTTDSILISGGNARALGLIPNSYLALDAFIEFNTAFAFDYDRSNGIGAQEMDFVGVAIHEIGHALGFNSVADFLDYNASTGATTANGWTAADFGSTPLDLFRYSTASIAASNANGQYITDVSVGVAAQALLIGNVELMMSTGVNFGNGQQSSHFLDNNGIGVMDPTASFGEEINISANDLLALDVIGWNLTGNAIPEPSTYGIGLGGLALAVAIGCRKRQKT